MLGDVRLAIRRLVAAPGFTFIVAATFAAGIGLNVAVFSLFDRVLLRTLAVHEPGRLVIIDTPGPNQGHTDSNKGFPRPISYPLFRDLKDRTDAFEDVLVYASAAVHLTADGTTEPGTAELVSGTYFPMLGVKPRLGRLLGPADDVTPSGHPVAVLSYETWTRRFGGDPGVVGKTLRMNATALEIVGVAPETFRGLEVGGRPDVYVPAMMKVEATPTWSGNVRRGVLNRRAMWMTPMARLRPGATIDSTLAKANALYKQVLLEELAEMPNASARFRERFPQKNLVLVPGALGPSPLRENAETPLKILMITAGLVLLTASLNIASLLLARATRRRREMAVRMSLGAGQARIFRQVGIEGAVVALVGLAFGLAVAGWAGPALASAVPTDGGAPLEFSFDVRLLAFACGVGLFAVPVSSVLPALQATRSAPSPVLREGSGSTGAPGSRARRGLVVAQWATSLALVFGALLLARSFQALATRSLGFDGERVVTFSVNPALAGYANADRARLFARVQSEIEALPGVSSASMSEDLLLSNSQTQITIRIPGFTPGEFDDMNPTWNTVGPAFFETLGITLRRGRDFTEADAAGAPRVAIVNEAFARQFFKGQEAVGSRFTTGASADGYEIVGVVADFRQTTMRDDESARQVFVPAAQQESLSRMNYYVASRGALADADDPLFAAIRSVVRAADPLLPIQNLRPFRAQMADALFTERFIARLASLFGAIALALAGLGLYGVTSFAVGQRTRELGVRMAIGADRGSILRLVLGDAARLAAFGLGLGAPLAAGLAFILRSQLFGVTAFDPGVIAASLTVLALAAVVAAGEPAVRAARIDPARSLRTD